MSVYLSHCNACDNIFPADLGACPKCHQCFDISPASVDPCDWAYDLECYPNCFTTTWVHIETNLTVVHEISDRRNDWGQLVEFMHGLGRAGARGVGFNNLGFDYPVLHWLVSQPGCDARAVYDRAMSIIRSDNKFGHTIWDNEQIFQQLDLYKVWHFDNRNKSNSLKGLEIAMRSRNVIDLPFPVGTALTSGQMDVLLRYNLHDVRETVKFYVRSLSEIQLRESLSQKYQRNMMNFSNTKIGMTILVKEMEEAGIHCYERNSQTGRREPRRTIREYVAFKDVIFPYIKFERPEFNEILEQFRAKKITSAQIEEEMSGKLKTKGVFKGMKCTVDGFTFVFGVGGIHGSIESQIVYSDDDCVIEDADVTSFYPKMAIENGMYPSHLGPQFCVTYNSIFNQRASYPKGTPENAALKEALNASYGNSNNVFSPLFDPFYTMQTTINGQLMLCMLAEQLMKIPGLTMIQANTDGITYRCPRSHLDHAHKVCDWWQDVTKLTLEFAHYSRMFIRDVNNYLAEYEGSGKLKTKGAYDHNPAWHQDPSSVVVAMAAEEALVRGESVREFIRNHRDKFDFMLRGKVGRKDSLTVNWSELGVEVPIQNTTRYFISVNGGELVKKSPCKGTPGQWKRKNSLTDEYYQAVLRELQGQLGELDSTGTPWDVRINTKNKSRWAEYTVERINAGWRVTECADADDFNWDTLCYDWYIEQAEKLVAPLLTDTSGGCRVSDS